MRGAKRNGILWLVRSVCRLLGKYYYLSGSVLNFLNLGRTRLPRVLICGFCEPSLLISESVDTIIFGGVWFGYLSGPR